MRSGPFHLVGPQGSSSFDPGRAVPYIADGLGIDIVLFGSLL